VFDCWKRFAQFVSGFFPLSMTKKELRKLGKLRPSLPIGFVIQSTTRSLQMGLERSNIQRAEHSLQLTYVSPSRWSK
jgi:hypothetical protein